jgi:hypothetical protein
MIAVVGRKNVDRILRFLQKKGEKGFVVGEVTGVGKK